MKWILCVSVCLFFCVVHAIQRVWMKQINGKKMRCAYEKMVLFVKGKTVDSHHFQMLPLRIQSAFFPMQHDTVLCSNICSSTCIDACKQPDANCSQINYNANGYTKSHQIQWNWFYQSFRRIAECLLCALYDEIDISKLDHIHISNGTFINKFQYTECARHFQESKQRKSRHFDW